MNRKVSSSLATISFLGLAACGGGGGGGEPLDGKQTTYSVGGSVSGLNLVTGQPVPQLTISNQSPVASDMKNVTVTGNAAFTFPAVPTGTDYRLNISSPTGYTCVFANANGNGQVAATSVTNLNVTCTAGAFSIGGTVTGLGSGNSGLQLANGSNLLQITGDGPFTFTQTALGGSTYSVAISVAHPQFECAVIGGNGTVGSANVNNIGVSCATQVRAAVTGLSAGNSIQLINDYTLPGATTAVADSQLTITGSSTGTFATRLPSGAQYSVRVSQGNPGFQCSVGNPTGTIGASIVTVNVACTPVFTVGGLVRGLAAGRTLVLRNNATDSLSITSNGAFTFPTGIASGATYSVTVTTQPSGEQCFVGGGYSFTAQTGTATAPVSDILVSCGIANSWTWIGGSNIGNGAATYGTKGTPSRTNIPRAASGSVTWTDSSRNFWMFGGGSSGDLWRYSPNTWAWTWVAGPGTANPFGVYGPKGAPSTLHLPGSRNAAVSWLGADGKLWLFGGQGFDQANQSGSLNDLWVFDPADSTWTWVSGAGAIGSAGVYGTQGVASTTNTPGARTDAIAWTDLQGNFWLLGGQGTAANGQFGYLNDLWKFRPTQRTWEWVGGSNAINSAGTFGTQNIGSTGNIPSARYGAVTWVDTANQLWMFGGYGIDSTGGSAGLLNDLWLFRPSGQMWFWVSGSNIKNASGNYGALQNGNVSTVPGARRNATGWIDGAGMLWLFGGVGIDSAGATGKLDDLWKYDTVNPNYWSWRAGHTLISATGAAAAAGVYGTLGVPDTANIPGAREGAKPWKDSVGEFWMFGGQGYDSTGNETLLNDLWRFRTN